jgi:hypothetical protein
MANILKDRGRADPAVPFSRRSTCGGSPSSEARSQYAAHASISFRRFSKASLRRAAELEASIKVEMEDICDGPTDIMISFSLTGTVGR